MLTLSSTPLRLTLGGGGSDLPSFANKYGGFVVTSSINKYIYVAVKERFEPQIRISYSTTEIVDTPSQIKHSTVREALRMLKLKSHIELVSMSDMPSQTGLGSSGSFTVGLLNALHRFNGDGISRFELAKEASNLTMNILKEPCGCQDTYIATFGGFICLDITPEGKVNILPLDIKSEVASELEKRLLFFYTGIQRNANEVLSSSESSDRR